MGGGQAALKVRTRTYLELHYVQYLHPHVRGQIDGLELLHYFNTMILGLREILHVVVASIHTKKAKDVPYQARYNLCSARLALNSFRGLWNYCCSTAAYVMQVSDQRGTCLMIVEIPTNEGGLCPSLTMLTPLWTQPDWIHEFMKTSPNRGSRKILKK